MKHHRLQSLVTLVGALSASVALACPNCPTSRVVRASVLNGEFWRILLSLSLPFLVIGFLTALLYRVGLSTPRRAASASRMEVES